MFNLDGGTVAGLFFVGLMVIILIFFYIGQAINRKKEEEWILENIYKTKLISVTNGDGSQSYTTTHGAIGRAAIGSAIAGPVGGIIGASTARKRTITTNDPPKYMFMVYYKDGTRERDTITEKDWKFEIYMDCIDLSD